MSVSTGSSPKQERIVSRFGLTLFLLSCFSVWAYPASGRDAILPQGDPRLQHSEEMEQDRREEIRTNRLKQQGQGEHYRIEGERQGGSDSTADESPDLGHRDTGMADPTVNPGQAVGMERIIGKIIESKDNVYTVREKSGKDRVLTVDEYTRGDTVLRPGDTITGKMTPQGRAIIVKKVHPEP